MKSFIITYSLVLLSAMLLMAQDSENTMIHGQILDSKSYEPVILVNIGIEGTLVGVASDEFGHFELEIPERYTDRLLYVSAVGYEVLQISIPSLLGKKDTTNIFLSPQTYGIDGVDINSASRVLYKIVRNAIRARHSIYVSQPFSVEGLYFSHELIGEEEKHRKAQVTIHDSKGYGTTNSAFNDRNYRFDKVYRNFEVKSFSDGSTWMDALLSYDVVRSPQNILNEGLLDKFSLSLIDDVVIEGDTAWHISYEVQPELSVSGDLNAESYKGEITISKKDYGIIEHVAQLESSSRSVFGRSFQAVEFGKASEVNYQCKTTYKRSELGLIFDTMVLKIEDVVDGKPRKVESTLKNINFSCDDIKIVTERAYFEKLTSDPSLQ